MLENISWLNTCLLLFSKTYGEEEKRRLSAILNQEPHISFWYLSILDQASCALAWSFFWAHANLIIAWTNLIIAWSNLEKSRWKYISSYFWLDNGEQGYQWRMFYWRWTVFHTQPGRWALSITDLLSQGTVRQWVRRGSLLQVAQWQQFMKANKAEL